MACSECYPSTGATSRKRDFMEAMRERFGSGVAFNTKEPKPKITEKKIQKLIQLRGGKK